jgi:GNAT superfamily N-acetyltransferase
VIAAMPVEIWDARDFTPAQARAIGELINQVWPKPNMSAIDRAAQQLALGRGYSPTASQAPRAMVVLDHDRVVAHAAMLPRTIGTEQGDLHIAGLSRVCTDPSLRGHGLGELVVLAALDQVGEGRFDFALFQTNGRVRHFYEKLGAVVVDNPIINSLADDPTARPFWDEIVMRYPADKPWPTGTIDLRGPGY